MPCWWDALDAEQFGIAAGGLNATCINVAPVTTDTTREPLAVYDERESFYGHHPAAFCETYKAWLTGHNINPDDTYRTEHHLVDAPFVRVFQYDRNAEGRPHVDPNTDDAARRDPFDVLIRTEPPKPEDYR
jgi:hypothetical protein